MGVCSLIICLDDTDVQHFRYASVLVQDFFYRALIGVAGVVAAYDNAEGRFCAVGGHGFVVWFVVCGEVEGLIVFVGVVFASMSGTDVSEGYVV